MTRARQSPASGQSIKVHGPALRFARMAFGFSLAEVATAAGVSVGFLARVERGDKRGVGREVFERIAFRLAPIDPRVLMVNPYVAQDTDSGVVSGLPSGIAPGIISGSTPSTTTAA